MKASIWIEITNLALVAVATATAIFGVWRFFYDAEYLNIREQQKSSVGYIEQFGTGDVLEAQKDLFDFWQSQKEFLAAAKNSPITARGYHNWVALTMQTHPESYKVRNSLLVFENFFERINYCVGKNLCDENIIKEYFCDRFESHLYVYDKFYYEIGKSIYFDGMGAAARKMSDRCSIKG